MLREEKIMLSDMHVKSKSSKQPVFQLANSI